MTLNSPEDLLKAIDLLLLSMDRPQRKLFLKWIKIKRNTYDTNFPMGKKLETLNEDSKPAVASSDTVLTVPDTSLIVPSVQSVSGVIVPGSVGSSNTTASEGALP